VSKLSSDFEAPSSGVPQATRSARSGRCSALALGSYRSPTASSSLTAEGSSFTRWRRRSLGCSTFLGSNSSSRRSLARRYMRILSTTRRTSAAPPAGIRCAGIGRSCSTPKCNSARQSLQSRACRRTRWFHRVTSLRRAGTGSGRGSPSCSVESDRPVYALA